MQPDPTSGADIAAELKPSTPARIAGIIAEHRRIGAAALAKIEQEGEVVRTLKGDVIAHPALRIHAEASKTEAALLATWGLSPLAKRPT